MIGLGDVIVSKVNESLYKNDVNTSYQCDSEKNITDFETSQSQSLFSLLSLETVDLKLEAFRVANTTTFSARKYRRDGEVYCVIT